MSGLKLGQDRKYLEDKAKREGLIVILPLPNEVFLDIDTPDEDSINAAVNGTHGVNERVLDYITQANCGLTLDSVLHTRSKSGNQHIYLRFGRNMNMVEKAVIQLCLGSDPIKEFFSFIQLGYVAGFAPDCECPIALFETPDQAALVEEWRKQ